MNQVISSKERQRTTELCAGGIVFRRTSRGVRVGFIRNAYRRWTFAKGHVKPDENDLEAALRETREEMGIRGLRAVEDLGSITIRFVERHRPELRGATIEKHIHFYLMEAPASAHGQPQREEKISTITWVSMSQAHSMVGYRNLKPVLSAALDAIVRINRREANIM